MSEYVNYDGLKRYDELIKNVISVKTWIGSCSTAAETAAKVISVENGFKLLKGVRIGVKFTATNTASNVTLNVNNTGAKSIYYNNAVYTETSNMICGYANRYVFYVYDGTNWVWDGYSNHDNTNTWKAANASQEGYVPKSTANKILRSDANGALYWGNDNNTTYSSKAAKANGTDVSLVTTGEKAIWNAKTSNTGTITGIKMNGVSKGTSGVVDLGTVITAHQDISGKADKTTTINGHALSSNVTVTKSDVGLGNVTNDALVKRSEMGSASGVATLDSAGKVPSSQLPSYVDDVLEYDTKSAFPQTGEGGKIYVDKSNNTTWRWSGSAYTQIKGDLVIGTTTGTAADGGIANTHYNNKSNPHGVTKSQVGLGSVVNTGDSATPVSGGTTKFTTGGAYTELAKKVDKVSGKGLSTNDYTTDEKNKLAGIASGAEVNVQSDWNATSGDAFIKNKPTIPAAANNGTFSVKTKVGSNDAVTAADFTANQSSADDVTFIQGSNTTLTTDTTNRTITIASADTKNTAGSTDSSSKLFLIGATSQAANPQTYSQDTAYVGTDGCLYSGNKKVATESQISAFGSSGIIDTHGEGTRAIVLDSGNDLYAFYQRGGTCTAYEVETSTTLTSAILTPTGTTVGNLSDDLFNGIVGYNQSPVYSGNKLAVYDLVMPSTYSWGSTFYWSFGASNWKPEKIRILVAKDNGDYVQKYTTDSCPTYGKADISNGSTGYNKIRLVVSKYSRLSLLGIRNYNYTGQRTTFMSRVISDPVYRSVSPAKNSVWDLGTTSNYWKNLYVTNINGVAVGSSPKFTDTTYESKSASSGGSDVSLVTTGEKYTWNSKTSNTGTVTSVAVKMNGASKGTVTTSGTIDLGTVITSHQDISGKVDKTTTVNGHALSSNVTVTKSDVGLGNVTNDSQVKRSEMGAASGVATLDSNGKVPSSQLPSYVDDVIEGYFYNSKFYKESGHTTEITGETGKIYVDLSTNKTYRWSGSAYAVISETLALGETSSTAYRGDRGKTAYTHSQTTSGNPHNVTKSDVGLGNVGNFKAVSTVASQGLTDTEKSNARTNIGAGTSSFSGSYNDLSNKPTIPAAAANGTYTVKTLVGSTTTNVSDFTANQSSADDVTFVQGSNVTITPDTTNRKITIAATDTTYGVVSTSANGLAPKVTDTSKFLKGDGTWATPTDTNNRRSFYGTCDTAAATAAKVITLSDTSGWELKAGTIVGIKFTNTNTASNVTLNVNNSGAKSIWYNNAAYTGNSNAICGYANRVTYYMYDGTQWVWLNMGSLDGNTDTKVTQTATTTSANYEVLFSATADNTTRTEGARKNSNLKFNPSTGNLQATQLNGVTIGSSPKFTDNNTKNTAGTTNKTGTKMFLTAATELSDNPVTYSNSNCYIGTDNCLYSGGNKVLTSETYTGTVTGVKIGTTSYSPSSGIVTIPAYPTTLPASDVSSWAKASTKPSYNYSEIGYTATETTSAGGAISINGTTPLQVITISAAVSGITFSAVPENGHSCHLIITATSDLSVAIAHGATMYTGYTSVCPSAEDISLDITAGGYVELDLLRVGTKIYIRGV